MIAEEKSTTKSKTTQITTYTKNKNHPCAGCSIFLCVSIHTKKIEYKNKRIHVIRHVFVRSFERSFAPSSISMQFHNNLGRCARSMSQIPPCPCGLSRLASLPSLSSFGRYKFNPLEISLQGIQARYFLGVGGRPKLQIDLQIIFQSGFNGLP